MARPGPATGVHGDELFPLLPGQSVGLVGQIPQDPTALAAVLERIRQDAGVRPESEAPVGVEVVRRRGADADHLFLIHDAGTITGPQHRHAVRSDRDPCGSDARLRR